MFLSVYLAINTMEARTKGRAKAGMRSYDIMGV